ncbi:MAG: carboxylating nicotinate-nucleotide diphosphorylase [Candidatus Omnitrophota bacterium]
MRAARKKIQKIPQVSLIITRALSEDIGGGDMTTASLIDKKTKIKAEIISKQNNIVVCGLNIVRDVFRQLDPDVKFSPRVKEGSFLRNKQTICELNGNAYAILCGERVALNFLGRLSGIATKTFGLTQKINRFKTKILDTRKTTPGLRQLEKYAVKTGGGYNHRLGLFDQVLVKDTHIAMIKNLNGKCGINDIVAQVRKKVKSKTIVEIEVSDLNEFKEAISAAPDIIMLDNMNCNQMKKAVLMRNKLNKKIKIEASGNINEQTLVDVAKCGVDYISLGMLTHSVNCADFSLKIKSIC